MSSIIIALRVFVFILTTIHAWKNRKSFAETAKDFMEWFNKNRENIGKKFEEDQALKDIENMP